MFRRSGILGLMAMIGVGLVHSPLSAAAQTPVTKTDAGSSSASIDTSKELAPRPPRRVIPAEGSTAGTSPSATRTAPAAQPTKSASVGARGKGQRLPGSAPNYKPGQLTALTGKVARKPWSKSIQSWNAGDGDYVVLVFVNDERHRHAHPELILRSTPKVSQAQLEHLDGKMVRLTGRRVEARPYTPGPNEQYPMDQEGKPLPRGAGFQVTGIQILP